MNSKLIINYLIILVNHIILKDLKLVMNQLKNIIHIIMMWRRTTNYQII